MNRTEFEEKIKSEMGEFLYDDNEGKYVIHHPKELKYTNLEFYIIDKKEDGISIQFYNSVLENRSDVQIDAIYYWSDVYELLNMALTCPEKLEYNENGTVSIQKSLNKELYNYKWNQDDSFLELNDMVVKWAIELVKDGYVSGLVFWDDRSGFITIDGSVCGELLMNFDTDQPLDDLSCGQTRKICEMQYCVNYVCGYIEYAYRNGFLDQLLRQRKMFKPSGPFEFTWIPKDGLKYIGENEYNLANQLVENGQIRVEEALDTEQRIVIWTGELFCKIVDSDDEISACALSCFSNRSKNTDYVDKNWFAIPINTSFISEIDFPDLSDYCDRCTMCAGCIYIYAGYIQYLKECGREDIIISDRDWFYKHQRVVAENQNSKFEFSFAEDELLDESKEMFEVAEILVDQNHVSLNTRIALDRGKNMYQISYNEQLTADKYKNNFEQLKTDVLNNAIEKNDFCTISFDTLDLRMTMDEYKIVLLAAYIEYLKKTGKYEDYQLKLFQHREHTEQSIENSVKEHIGLEKIYNIAKSKNNGGLYCVIEGERGVGKKQIVEQIAKLLKQEGKIDNAEYQSLTFGELATKLSYLSLEKNGTNTYENQYYVYSKFEKRELYVLTDLKEFIYATRKIKEGDGSKISHLLKLLGRYQPETYIVIIGEKKYVEQFINLSSQIKFLFGDNIITIENPNAEKLYEKFKGKLGIDLQVELKEKPEFKNEFYNYLALNRKLLPLGNQELAYYLADYANNRRTLVLPPDVYRKKSAKEMLASVIGMESVKKAAYDFEKYALFLKKAEMSGMELPNSNMHMIFTGNPGTGKTMVARIIGQMLFDLGIVEENKVIEVEGKDLKSQYIGETAIKTANVIDKAMGGVLFIDEAYAIGNDSHGKEAIATLIKSMEDHKDKFVVIFAGYEKEMYEFENINPGISSRIGYTFHFDDYSAEELVQMFDVKMKKAGFKYDDNILKRVRMICEHFAEKKNYGNGRFVDRLIQKAISKHSLKEGIENINIIIEEDIPTIEELVTNDVTEHSNYEEQLNDIIGMENVKQKVRGFAKFVAFQNEARRKDAQIPAANLHMIFTGNPGTGKTTIARVMVELLYDIGIIKEKKLIEVERKDLVSANIGQTAEKTSAVIERALNGVLFVDEAYSLTPKDSGKDFGAEAIATLIKAMEDHKNDLIVIFAGYKEEMRHFVNSNPGIASRVANTFDFEDYSSEELLLIFQKNMDRAGFEVTEESLKKIKTIFKYFSKKKNYGNGRFVTKLQQEIFMLHASNIKEDKTNLLRIDREDIPEISDLNNMPKRIQNTMELDNIIGMSGVKEKMNEFEALINFSILAKEHGLSVPNSNLHMIFTGNPGTGKTTIARIIAQKLFDIGIIMENKLVEAERKDLIAGYVGQTATKVDDVIQKAMGGVLFIDEAYSLTPKGENDFGDEAIATLIKAMEDHKDDLVVIFAGYKDEMNEFVKANPGISSRIGFTFHFDDYSTSELKEIFVLKMKKNGFIVTDSAIEKVTNIMQEFRKKENFGNGRFVDRIIQSTITKHSLNFKLETIKVIDEKDIPEVVEISKNMI